MAQPPVAFRLKLQPSQTSVPVLASNLAVISVDMWNTHWSDAADERLKILDLANKVNKFLEVARRLGVLIIHAPSACGKFYKDPANYAAGAYALKNLHASVPYQKDFWQQNLDFNKTNEGLIRQKFPWCYENFDPTTGNQLYEEEKDEYGKRFRDVQKEWEQKAATLRQDPKIIVEPQSRSWAGDYMVIDDYLCTEPGCPGKTTCDGHFHLAQLLDRNHIEYLLYVGVHTNYCVVFARPYSMWPMATFHKTNETDPDRKKYGQFKCVLIKELTDTFMHRNIPGVKPGVDEAKEATGVFLKWLISDQDTLHHQNKDNCDPDKGVIASTISCADLGYKPS